MMDLHTAGMVLILCAPFFLMTFWAVISASQKEFESLAKKSGLDDDCKHSVYWIHFLFSDWPETG